MEVRIFQTKTRSPDRAARLRIRRPMSPPRPTKLPPDINCEHFEMLFTTFEAKLDRFGLFGCAFGTKTPSQVVRIFKPLTNHFTATRELQVGLLCGFMF